MREGVDALRFGEYQRREVMTPRYFIFSYGMRFRLANNEAHFFFNRNISSNAQTHIRKLTVMYACALASATHVHCNARQE